MTASPAFADYLKTRRSTPFPLMQDPGPDEATLAAILQSAARVPDHGKLAPWRFILIDRAAGAKLGEALAGLVQADDPAAEAKRLEIERTRFSRSPLVVALVSRAAPHVKIPEWEQVLSAGAVGLNLIHAAEAQGFGANWVTEWPAYDRRVMERLGLEPHEKIAGFIHIGTPSGKAEDRQRPDMAAITLRFEG